PRTQVGGGVLSYPQRRRHRGGDDGLGRGEPENPHWPALKQAGGGELLAPPPGLEPEMPEPQSGVLPLHHGGAALPHRKNRATRGASRGRAATRKRYQSPWAH